MHDKLNIALLMGGDSGEYDVSIGSATVVGNFLDKDRFKVFPVMVHGQEWVYKPVNSEAVSLDKNDFSLNLNGGKIKFDCAFIAIHGTPGEDGKLQGYLDMAGISYTSCDLTTSAITFNKYFSNDLAIQYGMNVAKTIILRPKDAWTPSGLSVSVGLPCFVKPNKSGSSVGVTKVYKEQDFESAISKAFAEDNEVLVQQFIQGREMACGVFRSKGQITVLPVTEIIPRNDFFDYEAKYKKGMADEITPADISPEEAQECNKITAELYQKFNCHGVVRFDYFLSEGRWWFLEVNTVPGFSEGSIVPKQALAAGFGLKEFFGLLIDEALEK
jgi:D-alanine-D-alanine ligase